MDNPMTKPTFPELVLLIGLVGLTLALLNHSVVRAPQPAKQPLLTGIRSAGLAISAHNVCGRMMTQGARHAFM
jgi:hypothetical protein